MTENKEFELKASWHRQLVDKISKLKSVTSLHITNYISNLPRLQGLRLTLDSRITYDAIRELANAVMLCYVETSLDDFELFDNTHLDSFLTIPHLKYLSMTYCVPSD